MRYSMKLNVLAAAVFMAASGIMTRAEDLALFGKVLLETLDLRAMTQGWGSPHAGGSVDGHALKIGGKEFQTGVGTHAESEMVIDLKGSATRFTAAVGVDDEVGNQKGSVVFTVTVDGKKVFDSGVLRGGTAPKTVDVDLTGAKTLELNVGDAGDGIDFDHADWADATIVLADGATAKPVAQAAPEETAPEIATGDAKEPAIHGARIVGTTPGHPFIFKVPVTGEGEVKIAAANLPEGLAIDPAGIITGSVKAAGEYAVDLTATSALGQAARKLKIVAGDHKLALTPPMGWNSWNCFADAVSAEKVKAAADAMVSSGLINQGWTYINIDDFWEKNPGRKDPSLGGPGRDADGRIVPNPRFPDMKGLADYVHSKGLKIGLYSSPGPLTCGGCVASFDREERDAQSYAAWGFDYLKYDWCSYNPKLEAKRTGGPAFPDITFEGQPASKNLADNMRPYMVMRQALDKAPRDILFSLCQYGMADVWNWGGGPQVGGNCWRTCGDITDTWGSMTRNGFDVSRMSPHAGPGHWNDPDMLVVGKVGWGPSLHATHLTPNEQITHITLWSMVASPLLIGCDMTQLDAFTTAVLGNSEVIDIDQDPLGHAAIRISDAGKTEVWARPLSDGTVAVALFNRGAAAAKVSVTWPDLDKVLATPGAITGTQPVRDLWKRKDLAASDGYETTVPRHGAVLIKVGTPKAE